MGIDKAREENIRGVVIVGPARGEGTAGEDGGVNVCDFTRDGVEDEGCGYEGAVEEGAGGAEDDREI